MNIEKTIAALNNPMRRQILIWLKDRNNFPPPLSEHEGLEGVCVGYIQEKSGLSQSTISHYMNILKQAELVSSERHGQWTFFKRNEAAIQKFIQAMEHDLL